MTAQPNDTNFIENVPGMKSMKKGKAKSVLSDNSENIYKAIFENSIDAILIATSDGQIQSANPAACTMFGRTEKEIIKIGRDGVLDLTDERLPALLEERERTGKFSGEIRHKRKDGSVFSAEITSTAFKFEDGKEYTITIVRDISSRVLMENNLAESEKNQRALINAVDDSLFLIEANGNILLANNKLAEIFSKSLDELVGTNIYKLVTEDVAATRRKMAERSISEGCPVAFTDKRSGRFLEHRIFPVKDEAGKVTRLAILGRDITLQKEAEMLLTLSNEALVKSEDKFRMLINLSPSGIYMTDRVGKCTFVNEAWCMMAGMEPEEAYGDGWINAIHPGDRAYVSGLWDKYVNSGRDWNWSYRFIDKKGVMSWVYGISKPILDANGKTIGFIGTNTDITERKLIESQLFQSTSELRELTRHLVEVREEERTTIARDLHDDLGQKLTALNMDITWLKTRIGVQSKTVENKFQQMSLIMNDTIETVQKISFGLRPSILDDLGLIAAIEWQLTDFHKSSGLSCNFSCSPSDISVDANMSLVVFRIIQEALTNISRHSGATKVKIKISLESGILEVFVKDNGSGIEQDKIESTKSFGLIGMRERVRAVNGEISITGEEGEGTRVYVRIPVGKV